MQQSCFVMESRPLVSIFEESLAKRNFSSWPLFASHPDNLVRRSCRLCHQPYLPRLLCRPRSHISRRQALVNYCQDQHPTRQMLELIFRPHVAPYLESHPKQNLHSTHRINHRSSKNLASPENLASLENLAKVGSYLNLQSCKLGAVSYSNLSLQVLSPCSVLILLFSMLSPVIVSVSSPKVIIQLLNIIWRVQDNASWLVICPQSQSHASLALSC